MSQYLGDISAYALAVSQGYTGTEEEYAELMASYATVGQTAVTAAQTATTKASEAATSATTATNKASEATTAAQTATTKAAEAQADADAAALDASQALSAASTATTKATEATTAAATATSAKTDAVAANTAAQSAKTAAQTAQTGAETAAASVSASAAQIATNASDISQLKSEFTVLESYKFDELFSELNISEAQNLYNQNTAEDGFIAANGNISSSDTYCYSAKIPVEVGKTYSFWALYNGAIVSAKARFLCAYDSENNAVSASGSNSAVASYTVPNGIASIVVSFEQNRKRLFMVVDGTAQPNRFLSYNIEHYVAKPSFISNAVGNILRGDESLKMTVETASAGTDYKLVEHLDNKKNCAYSFFGKFSSFTSVEIGHGKTEAGANYLVIDGTNITSYQPNGTEYAHYAHNLTIADFIGVSIKIADKATQRAIVTIITNGGCATIGNVIFLGCNGAIYFACGQETTEVDFAYSIMDLRKDIYVFGDSYISLANDKRWPNYAIINNDNNMLLSGFPGASSNEEYPSFANITSMKNPKYICWFLGMNDPDSTSSKNNDWHRIVQFVLNYCDLNGIIPILATIPNTPTQNNLLKNEWVRNSGRRYVDFAKAVGAEELGSSWYTGMLSSDNVHPTEEGAKALWLRLRLDVPEIMQSITT